MYLGQLVMIESIVRFNNPPVVEVVAGVSFGAIPPDFGPILSAFWKEKLRDRFPSLQQQPPYSPPDEVFGDQPGLGGITFQFGGPFVEGRLWATSVDGTELLQLQSNWFARNWRKVGAGSEYDRWPSRRAALESSLRELQSYLGEIRMDLPSIRQCEVSYVNHIALEGVADGHAGVGHVLCGQEALSGSLPVEQATIQARYVIPDDGGRPIGRLHVGMSPALDAAGKPIYVLELTARGKPETPTTEASLVFLDHGRSAINATFVALTTPEMHTAWGRLQ